MTETAAPASETRGFLFADLRGYTAFAEKAGDQAAAELLEHYRAVVRDVIPRFDGAEIRTEGDSFYVVFRSASTAIRAGLEILQRAADASDARPIRVAIGVHTGEATATAEGYVGSAVNVAARICALAGPGELLVSETARAIARGQLAVGFVPRGRRRLKGIGEPVALYAVTATALAPIRRWSGGRVPNVLRGRLDRLALPAALAVGVLILTAVAIAVVGRSLGGRAQENPSVPAAVAPSPETPAPSAQPSVIVESSLSREDADNLLVQEINPDVARHCDSAEARDAPKVTQYTANGWIGTPLPILGGLRCELGGGAAPDVVSYWRGAVETQPGYGAGSEDAFFNIVGERNLPQGDCSSDTRAWDTWEFLGRTGNILCSRFGGEALLAWTYQGEAIIALAEREDGDSQRLYRWWLDNARELDPEPAAPDEREVANAGLLGRIDVDVARHCSPAAESDAPCILLAWWSSTARTLGPGA